MQNAFLFSTESHRPTGFYGKGLFRDVRGVGSLNIDALRNVSAQRRRAYVCNVVSLPYSF